MAAQVTNYQCPSCTGPLHFVGASGKLECDYCGSTYDVAEIEALYAEKEEQGRGGAAVGRRKRRRKEGSRGRRLGDAGPQRRLGCRGRRHEGLQLPKLWCGADL
ncbi:MAG: hypothetical protein ACLU38_09830 [Dysosmobacter sp.]